MVLFLLEFFEILGILEPKFKKPGSDEPDHEFPSMVCEKSMQKGVLFVHTGRESIKFGPPLTITDAALLEGIEVLCQSIHELTQSIV